MVVLAKAKCKSERECICRRPTDDGSNNDCGVHCGMDLGWRWAVGGLFMFVVLGGWAVDQRVDFGTMDFITDTSYRYSFSSF
jgi:hypothetical protein